MPNSVTKGSPAWKELEKLGANMDRATADGSCSFFDISLDFNLLDRYGYKRIHTNSHDHTSCAYTDGTWVINMVACTGGYVSIYKLGPKAKETIDAGEVFDEFNRSLEEDATLTESDKDSDQYAAEFAEKLEDRVKKAFPGCKYEEIIKAHGSNKTDHIYVTVASHTYEVEFNVAAQEEDIKEMGAEKAAKVYADDAIQNIQKQIIFVANNPSGMPNFNRDNAATFLDELEAKIKAGVKEFMMKPEIGFPENEVEDYSSVSADINDDYIQISVGAELSYEPLSDLCDALNPIVAEYDDNSYFEPECPGRIVAYLFIN